jgi:ribosome maturation protein SDO1
MVSVEKAVIARISRSNMDFEILVDPYKALELRRGKSHAIENILAVNEIFRDVKKGERSSAADLETAFGTTDVFAIAETIIKHGDLQLTTEQKRELMEEKKRQIANIISKQGINPKTKLPNPPARILNAMEEAHVNIDPLKDAESQVESVVTKIQEILPIHMERVEIAIKVPMQYAGKVSSALRTMAPIKEEEWLSDSWIAVIEIPAGMQSEILSKLNDMTAGTVETKVVKTKGV